MTPRSTLRLDHQRAFGFGRQTAVSSTPVGALASDVCSAWATAAAMPAAAIATQRDRSDVQQFSTTKRSIVNGAAYTPSQQSQSRIGAGTEGGDRSP